MKRANTKITTEIAILTKFYRYKDSSREFHPTIINNCFRMKKISLFLLIVLLTNVLLKAANYNVTTASFLGGTSTTEIINGVQIQSDGTIVLAGQIGLSSIKGVSSTNLNGASGSSMATIVRLSSDGQTVKSVTKIGTAISDMVIDGNDNIYIALGTEGALKLNSTASTVLLDINDLDIYRVDAGTLGFCAMLGKVGQDFGGYHTIRIYKPDGTKILDRYTDMRCIDLALSEENKMVVTTGFNMYFQSGSELHMTFFQGITFNGAIKYTGYDWNANDWVSNNWGEQTRGNTITIGQDGFIYLANTWCGKGYNCLERDPFNRAQYVSQVKADKYMNIDNMRWGEEGDSKKKLFFGKYNILTGAYINGVAFANAASEGPGTVSVSTPGCIQVDINGNLYFAGSSSAKYPVPPEYTAGSGEEAINPTNNSYCGYAVSGVLNSSLNKRLFAASYDGNALKNIAIRSLNGTMVQVLGGVGKSTSYIKSALQSAISGTVDAYFIIINSPGTASIPTAPSNLITKITSSTKIGIEWNDNSSNEDGFIIERKIASGSFVQIAKVSNNKTSLSDISVDPNTSYTYRVCAFNLTGKSTYTSELSLSTGTPNIPATPTGLIAQTLNQSQVYLIWNDVNNETGYIIEQQKYGDSYFTPIIEQSPNQTSFTVTNLLSGIQYTYRVRAFNNDGFSAYSTNAVVTTATKFLYPITSVTTVQGLCYKLFKHTGTLGVWPDFNTQQLVKSGTVINLDVDASNDNYDTDYDIRYSGYINVPTDGTYTFTNIAEKGAMLFIDDSLVIDNSTWKWGPFTAQGQIGMKAGKHKFICEFFFSYAKGEFDPLLQIYIEGPGIAKQLIPNSMLQRDNACTLTGTIPAAPSNLNYQIISGNTVKITWNDNSNNESAFCIEHSPINWNTYDQFKEMIKVGSNTTSYIFSNLKADSSYELRIRALNAFGYSTYSSIITFKPTGTISNIPAPPDMLQISYVSGDKVSLIWRDNSYNESNFVIESKMSGGSFSKVTETDQQLNSVTINGLNPNTTYSFRIFAKNSYGNSGYSNEVTVKTLMVDESEINLDVFYVYPNPVKEILNIKGKITKPVVITDISGKIVMIDNGINEKINVSQLDAGLYLLLIEDYGMVIKLIKE